MDDGFDNETLASEPFSNLTSSLEEVSEALEKVFDAFFEVLRNIIDYDKLVKEIKEIISKSKKRKYNLYSVRNNCKKYNYICHRKRKGIPYYRRDFSAHF